MLIIKPADVHAGGAFVGQSFVALELWRAVLFHFAIGQYDFHQHEVAVVHCEHHRAFVAGGVFELGGEGVAIALPFAAHCELGSLGAGPHDDGAIGLEDGGSEFAFNFAFVRAGDGWRFFIRAKDRKAEGECESGK